MTNGASIIASPPLGAACSRRKYSACASWLSWRKAAGSLGRRAHESRALRASRSRSFVPTRLSRSIWRVDALVPPGATRRRDATWGIAVARLAAHRGRYRRHRCPRVDARPLAGAHHAELIHIKLAFGG